MLRDQTKKSFTNFRHNKRQNGTSHLDSPRLFYTEEKQNGEIEKKYYPNIYFVQLCYVISYFSGVKFYMLEHTANDRNHRLRSDFHQLEIPECPAFRRTSSRSAKTQTHRETINIGAYINRTLQTGPGPSMERYLRGMSSLPRKP